MNKDSHKYHGFLFSMAGTLRPGVRKQDRWLKYSLGGEYRGMKYISLIAVAAATLWPLNLYAVEEDRGLRGNISRSPQASP